MAECLIRSVGLLAKEVCDMRMRDSLERGACVCAERLAVEASGGGGCGSEESLGRLGGEGPGESGIA